MVSYGELTNFQLIDKRDFSEIYECEHDGEKYCVKYIHPCHRFSIESYKNSYNYYDSIRNKFGLVEVHDHFNLHGKYVVVMDFLKGKRIEYSDASRYSLEMKRIFDNLVHQGILNLDYAPINFMDTPRGLMMVDLDNLVRIDSLVENPQVADFSWSWFGSRYGKLLQAQVK